MVRLVSHIHERPKTRMGIQGEEEKMESKEAQEHPKMSCSQPLNQ